MGDERFRESGDYWKLTKDGRLLNDGKARLLAEVTNDDGTMGWKLVEGSEKETSVPAALVHYLGKDRAALLLGSNSKGMSDELIGESLMKGAGIAWDANGINPDTKKKGLWIGGGSGLTITDQAFYGNAAMRSLGNGLYERYSITGQIYREKGAYDVYKNGVKGDIGDGNTKLEFTKWNLDTGRAVGNKVVSTGVWNSVDNSYGQLDKAGNPIGADQPYKILFGALVQGNTVASGTLNMRWAQENSATWGERMLISDTYTIAGDYIGADAKRIGYPNDLPTVLHYTNFGSSDGCVVSIGEQAKKDLLAGLKNMGMYRGYAISSMLYDRNWTFGYKKGRW
jgi:hypothetical protein